MSQFQESNQAATPQTDQALLLLRSLIDEATQSLEASALLESTADWSSTLHDLSHDNPDLGPDVTARLRFFDVLRVLTDLNVPLLVSLARSGVSSLAELATEHYHLPLKADEYQLSTGQHERFQSLLFAAAPTAVIRGLVKYDRIQISPPASSTPAAKALLLQILDQAVHEGLDITRTSARSLLTRFQTAPTQSPSGQSSAKDRAAAINAFQIIQRLQAVALKPSQIGLLMQAKLFSAHAIAAKDQKVLARLLTPGIDLESIARIQEHAVLIDTRNEQAWIQLLKTRSSHLLPALPLVPQPVAKDQLSAAKQAEREEKEERPRTRTKWTVSLETLFKEVDTASCEHCSSIISPAAYLVDLLRMLEQLSVHGGQTLLDKLFERRADLGTLQLSCANTNNLIPYIDLVHEALQSFASSLAELPPGSRERVSVTTPVQLQHQTDLSDEQREVYFDHDLHLHHIRKQVFPLNRFPYNFAQDSIELCLKAANTSRLDVAKTFCSAHRLKRRFAEENQGLVHQVSRRARVALQLGLDEEEIVLLTGESIYSWNALAANQGALTEEAYRERIGHSSAGAQWGYRDDAEMLDEDEETKTGLTFVQAQLLPRGGVTFQDLTGILQTEFLGRRLVLTPAHCSGTFSQKLEALRLRGSALMPESTGSLTATVCRDLLAFTRLLRRLDWSVADLDAALSGILRSNPATGPQPGITFEVLESIAAVQSLHHETDISIQELMSLWSNINTYGPNSLYNSLFLRKRLGPDQKLFQPNSEGQYLTQAARLSEASTTIQAVFALSSQEFQDLCMASNPGVEEPWLTMSTVSSLYRHALLCRIFQVPARHLAQFLYIQGGELLYSTPEATLEAVTRWKRLCSTGSMTPATLLSLCISTEQSASSAIQQVHPQSMSFLRASSAGQHSYLQALRNEAGDCTDRVLDYLVNDPILEPITENGTSNSAARTLKRAYELAKDDAVTRAHLIPSESGDLVLSVNPEENGPGLVTLKLNQTLVVPENGRFVLTQLQRDQIYELESNIDLRAFTCKNIQGASLPSLDANLVPGTVFTTFIHVVRAVKAASQVARLYNLDEEELKYISEGSLTGPGMDFAKPTLNGLHMLQEYADLRELLISRGMEHRGLVRFLQWVNSSPHNRQDLLDRLTQLTGSAALVVADVLQEMFPDAQDDHILISSFQSVDTLRCVVDIIGFPGRSKFQDSDLPLLFKLAEPPHPLEPEEQFSLASDVRQRMQKLLQFPVPAKTTAYAQVLDTLVERCRGALIQYLLNHDYIRGLSLRDADSLFEHFLIDVQMGPGPKTSRIKQAISTVQLYVQRCLLGLEHTNGVPSSTIDRDHWSWMCSYPLWEANRKVFLYPENWADPTLRDDKSDLFKELEAKIMQSNLDMETISQIVKGYVYGLNELADLEMQAYLWDTQTKGRKTLHLFSKTRSAPYIFYYRKLEMTHEQFDRLSYWSPWQKIDLEIPTFEVDASGQSLQKTGSYLLPTIRRGRVYLFIPQIMLKTAPSSTLQTPGQTSASSTMASNTTKYWEVRMGWTELRNGNWSAKRVSQAFLKVEPIAITAVPAGYDTVRASEKERRSLDRDRLPEIDSFKFWIRSSDTTGSAVDSAKGVQDILNIDMEFWYLSEPAKGLIDSKNAKLNALSYPLGRFQIREYDISVVDRTAMPANYAKEGQSTLPTRFSKLEWEHSVATDDDKSRWKPQNEIYHGDVTNKPLLAKVYSESKSTATRQMSWTMSFDDSQASQPTGLVVDMKTQNEGNQSFLLLPPSDTSTSDGSGAVYAMNNNLAPFFMERATSVEGLGSLYHGIAMEIPTKHLDAFGLSIRPWYHELGRPYSLYNWELGFHVIALLMERLLATQQLDLALQVARYVFDPSTGEADAYGCWHFPPFQEPQMHTNQGAAAILDMLEETSAGEASKLDHAVSEWRRRPFAAHVMARQWPVAYMKRIVRKYIEILIASGDAYFRQGTLESMPLAIQRYVEASHLFGARPRTFPRLGKTTPVSFNDLAGRLNCFSTASVDLELDFPFVREPDWRGYSAATTSRPSGGRPSGLLGFVRTGYFCIPANPDLVVLRDLIDDRLYKIRNCQDINGRGVTLRLFEPGLDPMALVRGQAAGTSLASFLAEASAPMPKLRFQYLLGKALELCSELKSMGDQFLAIKEKRDGEALSTLKSAQEMALQGMALEIKRLQRSQAEKALEGLQQTRRSHETRLNFYLRLIGENEQIPAPDQEWQEIQQNIDRPTMDDLRMSNNEKQEFDLASEAAAVSLTASTLETVAAGLLALPRVQENIDPMGMGVSVQFDASNIAQYMMGTSSVMKLLAQMKSDQSSRAARKAQMIRQLQERRLQANMAGQEIAQVDKQIAAQRIQLQICENEIGLQEKQIEQIRETDLYYKTKYTNEKLYAWMDSSFYKIYQDTYLMASDMARKAQRAFEFESGRGSVAFLRDTGYWDKSRDGLLSSHQLYLDLKRMERAHLESRFHDFEISKSISLRQIDPLALLKLRSEGETTFSLPELLFDMDFPGHYLRRIKSVSLSISCIIGPYTSANCTLQLLQHAYRVEPQVKDVADYNTLPGHGDARFRTDSIPIEAVAVSSANADAGLFEVNFSGERYLPFEGAGVISQWKLQLPPLRQFNYDTISDVVLHVCYTAVDGGTGLRDTVTTAVKESLAGAWGSKMYALIDVKNDYANEWRQMMQAAAATAGDATTKGSPVALRLPQVNAKLPFWAAGKNAIATLTSLLVSHPQVETSPVISWAGSAVKTAFVAKEAWKDRHTLLQDGTPKSVDDWTLSIPWVGGEIVFDRLFLIVEYMVEKF